MIFKKPIRRRPFGMPITPFNPKTGAYLPLGNPNEIKAFSLVEEHASHLLCKSPVPVVGEEDTGGVRVIIAKPFILRRDMFDGKTINGITYDYPYTPVGEDTKSDSNIRTAEDEDGNIELQRISFPYTIDDTVPETIIAFKRDGWATDYDDDGKPIDTKIHYVWEDLNVAGRGWTTGDFYGKVVSYEEETDTYTIQPLDPTIPSEDPEVWEGDPVPGVIIPGTDGGVSEDTKIWVGNDYKGRRIGVQGGGGGGFWSVVVSYEAGTYTVTPWNFKTGTGDDNVSGVNIPNSNGGIVAGTEIWIGIDSYGSYVGAPWGLFEPWS